MVTVLVSGGNGLIGQHLCQRLMEKGYNVGVLSRTKNKSDAKISNYYWDIDKQEIEKEAIETADYIIHLAGENIGEKRWTSKRKKKILESRHASAKLIIEKVNESNHKPKAFISASAIGYYGAITSDHIFIETDSPAQDFLGETCRKWEEIADEFKELGIRTVKLRTGVVLSKHGGALAKMMSPIRMGIGSTLGTGRQYMPWIHIEDLCNIYIKAIEDEKMQGAYNAVAPEHKTNLEFTKSLAQTLDKPFWFPAIPSFVLKIIFGKMSVMMLKGSRVSSGKITNAGFNFRFPDLKSALKDLVRNA
ncbi:MAG: TIGR01777 family oxidoreductase [Bacteroidota bacterium]